MIDAGKLLSGMMRGGFGGSTRKSIAGGSGLVMLGGIAYAAYEHYSQKNAQKTAQTGFGQGTAPPFPPPAPPPPPTQATAVPPTPPPAPSQMPSRPASGMIPVAAPPNQTQPAPTDTAPIDNDKALLLVKAMIAAAKSDGEIDATERANILKALDDQGQDGEAQAFLEAEMAKPLNLFEITSQVTDEITAVEVYTASCLAIDIDTTEERQYLDKLAARIGIEPEQAQAIEAELQAKAIS